MSSAAALQPLLHPRTRPTTVPPGPGPSRPPLRVLEGGRAPSRLAARSLYRRRRLVAAILVVALAVAAVVLVNAVMTRIAGDGTPNAVAGSSAPSVHVVQPGDTLWSIAGALDPEGDVRLVVDRLVELNGRAPITVGQRLELP